jgi:hypothetical protein
MIAAVVIAVAVLLWLAMRRSLRPSAAAVALAVLALALLGTHLLDSFVIDHNYGGSASDEASERIGDFLSLSGMRTAAANLLGQAWYLIVATFGLSAALLADFVLGRRRAGEGRPAPVIGVLLALTGLLLLISAAAFPERTRPDMLIYGRYTEVAAPALVAFGLAALARARLPSWRQASRPLLGFCLLTAAVVLIRATGSEPDAANRWNVSALPFVTVQLGPAILLAAALVAVAGAWLLLRASALGPRALGSVAVALFAAVIAYGAWNPVRSSQRAVYPTGWTSPQAVVAAAGARTVAYDLDHYDTIGLYTVQWFLPDTPMRLFHGAGQAPPSRYVLSSHSWRREHPRTGARAIWSALGRDEVLWRLSGRQAP